MQIAPKLGTDKTTPDAREPDPKDAARVEAARKFEAVLIRQLLSVMRSTAKSGGMMGSEGASGQYTSMFDEAIADKLAESGGIGLASHIVESLGGDPSSLHRTQPSQALPSAASALGLRSTQGGLPLSASADAPGVAPPLPGLRGATARLAQAAYAISAPQGGKQWAREGTLTERDLASPLATATTGGVARFSVDDAQGFRDNYKCNLFAFEAARRAGFEVPVVARNRGWGFPTSGSVTEDAQDGALRGNWAEVVPSERIGEVQAALERGDLGLMLTGSGTDGRHGHMAVVERIHDVQLDEHGEVKRIVFDGYEARVDGAEHLVRRTWNRQGSGTDSKLARNGFGAIELLALHRAKNPQAPEITLSARPRASREP